MAALACTLLLGVGVVVWVFAFPPRGSSPHAPLVIQTPTSAALDQPVTTPGDLSSGATPSAPPNATATGSGHQSGGGVTTATATPSAVVIVTTTVPSPTATDTPVPVPPTPDPTANSGGG